MAIAIMAIVDSISLRTMEHQYMLAFMEKLWVYTHLVEQGQLNTKVLTRL